MNLTSPECKKDIPSEDAHALDHEIYQTIIGYTLQMVGPKAVESIIDRLNLEPFYEFYLNFNRASNLPYHNLYHAHCMILNCYEGAWHSNVEDDDLRGLITAALMHDFNHSGGKTSDGDNIKEALHGLQLAQSFAKSRLVQLSDHALEIASQAIAVTEFTDGKFVRVPTTLTERIIRDADLMQPYEQYTYKLIKQFTGLKAEIEFQRKVKFSAFEFAIGLKQFQDTQTEWFTEWALEKSKIRNWELCKHRLSSLLREL